MAAYILCDTRARENLFPFTYTRPVADCRCGILTIREKWEYWLKQRTTTLTEGYLSEKFPLETKPDNYWINGGLLPDEHLIEAMHGLEPGECLIAGDTWLMTRSKKPPDFQHIQPQKSVPFDAVFRLIRYSWNLFQMNDAAIRSDYQLLAQERTPVTLGADTRLINRENVFIEKGASILCSTLNASEGPIYIGKNTLIMEGCHIRGPFALCEGAVVKMGTKIYGATTIGPRCEVGGEIKNSILFGFSNKAHGGYLGDSVLGEWCNLGGGTTNSNLKNNIGEVKIWNTLKQDYLNAGNKCGMLMGDYSRTGINTMINTGTSMGISCNIFDGGFPPKYIPSFSWRGSKKIEKYEIEKAVRDAKRWMKLKGKEMDADTEKILRHLYEEAGSQQAVAAGK